MEQIFVMTLMFSSWDQCWDSYHENREYLQPRAGIVCEAVEVPVRPSPAPATSIRPKGRDDR